MHPRIIYWLIRNGILIDFIEYGLQERSSSHMLDFALARTEIDLPSLLKFQTSVTLVNACMILFVDKTGKYLVVEASKITLGNEEKFALANFSIADTKDLTKIKIERFYKLLFAIFLTHCYRTTIISNGQNLSSWKVALLY